MPPDYAPSFQFYPRDYMADPDVQALTWEQRGRYHWALCCSALSLTPGVAPEDDWARWMGYSQAEWEAVRSAHKRCFLVRDDGVWVQERMRSVRAEQRARFKQAKEAGRASGVARRVKSSNRMRTEDERNANGKPTPASASASASALDSKSTSLSAGADTRVSVAVWFERYFWPTYPRTRNVSKADALEALRRVFSKLTPEAEDALGEAIMDGLERYAKAMNGSEERFILHPVRWIKQRRWETALEPTGTH